MGSGVVELRPRHVLALATVTQPEKRLMIAILDDAIRSIRADPPILDRRAGRARDEAEAWVATDDYEWPFSFVSICQALDLDPARVRRYLAARRRSARADGIVRAQPAAEFRRVQTFAREWKPKFSAMTYAEWRAKRGGQSATAASRPGCSA